MISQSHLVILSLAVLKASCMQPYEHHQQQNVIGCYWPQQQELERPIPGYYQHQTYMQCPNGFYPVGGIVQDHQSLVIYDTNGHVIYQGVQQGYSGSSEGSSVSQIDQPPSPPKRGRDGWPRRNQQRAPYYHTPQPAPQQPQQDYVSSDKVQEEKLPAPYFAENEDPQQPESDVQNKVDD